MAMVTKLFTLAKFKEILQTEPQVSMIGIVHVSVPEGCGLTWGSKGTAIFVSLGACVSHALIATPRV